MLDLAALIFDVDGTLAETEELHRVAFNETFAAAGLPWHWDQALYADLLRVTGGKERIVHFEQIEGHKAALSPDQVAALHRDKTARYTARVATGSLALRPGLRRLLLEAQAAGLKLAIATTTSRPNVEALLAACAPVPAFDVIAAGDEVAAKKPAPDIYTLALERLGLPAAACIALEDTANGLRSARDAGLGCVMTVSAYGRLGPFDGAVCVLSHLGDAGDPAEVIAGPPLAGDVVDLAYLAGLDRLR